jgi:hypothetical protein
MAWAVAGVCSCNHENSKWVSFLEFRQDFTWWLEQTPTTAAPILFTHSRLKSRGNFEIRFKSLSQLTTHNSQLTISITPTHFSLLTSHYSLK